MAALTQQALVELKKNVEATYDSGVIIMFTHPFSYPLSVDADIICSARVTLEGTSRRRLRVLRKLC